MTALGSRSAAEPTGSLTNLSRGRTRWSFTGKTFTQPTERSRLRAPFAGKALPKPVLLMTQTGLRYVLNANMLFRLVPRA